MSQFGAYTERAQVTTRLVDLFEWYFDLDHNITAGGLGFTGVGSQGTVASTFTTVPASIALLSFRNGRLGFGGAGVLQQTGPNPTASGVATFFFVAKWTTSVPTLYAWIFAFASPGAEPLVQQSGNDGAKIYVSSAATAQLWGAGTSKPAAGEFCIVGVRVNGASSTITIWRHGAGVLSFTVAGAVGASTVNTGAHWGDHPNFGNSGWGGSMAMMARAPTVFDDATMARVFADLSSYYDIVP